MNLFTFLSRKTLHFNNKDLCTVVLQCGINVDKIAEKLWFLLGANDELIIVHVAPYLKGIDFCVFCMPTVKISSANSQKSFNHKNKFRETYTF